MATPFDTAAPEIVPATDSQLGLISALLAERVWNDTETLAASYISRTAVINTLLANLENLDAAPGDFVAVVTEVEGLGARLNKALAFMADAKGIDAKLWAPLTKSGASKLIEWLKGRTMRVDGTTGARVERTLDRMEAEARAEAPAPVKGFDVYRDTVPAGRYAIDTGVHAVNGTAFYKVDRPTEGRWAGRVFVKQIIGGEEQRLSQKQGLGTVKRIAEYGAERAAARYGHEIGECGMCGRQLTNEESRARGIGPICAAKAGW